MSEGTINVVRAYLAERKSALPPTVAEISEATGICAEAVRECSDVLAATVMDVAWIDHEAASAAPVTPPDVAPIWERLRELRAQRDAIDAEIRAANDELWFAQHPDWPRSAPSSAEPIPF